MNEISWTLGFVLVAIGLLAVTTALVRRRTHSKGIV
jgi:hypothetical protein